MCGPLPALSCPPVARRGPREKHQATDATKRDEMGKTVLLTATILLAAVLATVGPASAQILGSGGDPDLGSATPVPGTGYEITDDGFLIYQGDILIPCEALDYDDSDIKFADSDVRADLRRERMEAYEERVEICTEAGFPPKGAQVSASASASASASVPASPGASAAFAAGGVLPETGGAPLGALVLGAGAIAAAGALLVSRARR